MEDSVPAVGESFTIPEAVNPEVIATTQEQVQQQVQQTQEQAAGSGADSSGVGGIVEGVADIASAMLISDTEASGDVVGEFFGGVAEVAGGALEFIGDLLGGL